MTDNNQQLTNVEQVQQYGMQAARLWNSSERDGAKGDSLAIVALFQAYHTMTFEAHILDKKTKTVIQTDNFDLADYIERRGCMNEDGVTKNVKLMNARTNAVALKVFGIEEPDNAMKQRLIRAFKIVRYLAMDRGLDETQVKITKRGELQVPYTVMHDEPGENASTKEREQYEKLADGFSTIDGKDGDTLAALGRKATPQVEQRAPQQHVTPEQRGMEFVASVNFIKDTLAAFLDDSGEKKTDVPAPNNDVEAKLFELQRMLASYFKAGDKNEKSVDNKAA